MTTVRAHHTQPWAGQLSGPAAWAINTQLGYALVPWSCAHGINLIPWVALIAALLAAAGGLVSWRVWRDQAASDNARFVAVVGLLLAALFALVILMQGAAGLVFQGCER
jgi:hypothetical protein